MNREDTYFLEGLKHTIYLLSPPIVREQLYATLSALLIQCQLDLETEHGQTLTIGEIFSRIINQDMFLAYLDSRQ